MRKTRVIPVLLLKGRGLVKTTRFKNPIYVGDPINVVRILNEKEIDELMILDIAATSDNREPDFDYISLIASECFMPLCYGGGIRNISDIEKILKAGVEKTAINTQTIERPDLIREASTIYGSQSIVAAIDIKTNRAGKPYVAKTAGQVKLTDIDPAKHVREMVNLGAGEIFFNSVDRDGTAEGYDLKLLNKICNSVSVPMIASGGAGCIEDFLSATKAGASAVAAGSMFVFHGKYKAVLINYPDSAILDELLP